MIMAGMIIEAVSAALNYEFGDGYTYYAERVEQGLKEPCFFIQCINSEHSLFLGLKDKTKRYRESETFCVQYFPLQDGAERMDCHEASGRMAVCLEWIKTEEGLYRGKDMHSEINDGTLSFFVEYDFFTRMKGRKHPEMRRLEKNIEAGG